MLNSSPFLLPDVFLGGTPKSGTTFLFDLLAQHPQINPSTPKEPFFYVDETCPFNQKYGLNAKSAYHKFFSAKGDGFALDGTSQTIYQSNLLKQIECETVKPKMIVLLREPARRIYSSFGFTKNNLGAVKSGVNFKDYTAALLSHDVDSIRKMCRDNKAFYSLSRELDFSNYNKYLIQWRKALGADRLKVIFFEDLMSDTENQFKVVLNFLELDTHYKPQMSPSNETVVIRNQKTHYWLYKAFGAVGYRLPFKAQLKKWYASLQHDKPEISEADRIAIERLRKYFEPMNADLGKTLKLDLKKWQ